MINPNAIEQIKDQIIEIISPRVELRRRGTNWTGLCPFHDDTKPSFSVSEKKRLWHCFVCNEGGDAIDFIKKINGTDFIGALSLLGVQSDPDLSKTEHSDRIMRALEEIRHDANTLIKKLEWETEHLQFLSRQVNWLINSVPPLEREAWWYSWELWLDAEFCHIQMQREKIQKIAARHRAEVFQWAKQSAR